MNFRITLKNPILFIFLIFSTLSVYSSLQYKKNKHIKMREKYQNKTRILEDPSIKQIDSLINSKSNFLIFFYAFYCVHCKELFDTINTLSTYKFIEQENFHFLRLDCTKPDNKDLCHKYSVFQYPTLKIFLKGEETKSTPNEYDLESMLEYIDKITSPSLIKVNSDKKLKQLSEDHGDNSFLLIIDGEDRYNDFDIKECYQKLAEDKDFKPLFYFFLMKKNKYKNEFSIKLPAIINLGINSQFNLHQSFPDFNLTNDCHRMRSFIEENKYPVIKRLDNFYLSRVGKDKKILIIAAINKSDINHINFLNNFFHNIALRKRNLVFTYLDIKEDSHFLQFFKIGKEELNNPKIIFYDFYQGKHYIDKFNLIEQASNIDKDHDKLIYLNELIEKIETDEIPWTTGYILEDIIHKFGFKISRTGLMTLTIGVITFVLIIIIMCTCSVIEKNQMMRKEEDDKKIVREDMKNKKIQ
jgi:thiol-disulfide isomerase/thioredoxin